MLPSGFLGTRADLLMDIVILSLVVILPVLAVSWRMARRAEYGAHRAVQVTLASVLAFVVLIFEADLRLSGGIFELTKGSRFVGTTLLNGSIYFHTLCSIATTVLWAWLIIISLKRFGKPPAPGAFSARHRQLGISGMVLMALTGVTGIELYVVGFAM